MNRRELRVAIGVTVVLLGLVGLDLLPALRWPARGHRLHSVYACLLGYFPLGLLWSLGRLAVEGAAVISRCKEAVAISVLLAELLVASDTRWARERPRVAARALLAAAVVLGAGFQLYLIEPDGERTLLARVRRLSTWSAGVRTSDPLAFLDRHAQLEYWPGPGRRTASTYAPGPIVYYAAWNALCEREPGLTRATLSLAGLPHQAGHAVPRAAALLGGLLLLLVGAATCLPIASLLRSLGRDELSAARVAALWPLVPGAALLSPPLASALALPVAGSAALLAIAVSRPAPRRWLAALVAGSLAFLAWFCSYGAAAFIVVGVVAVAAAHGVRGALKPVALAGVAALGWLDVTMLLGHEPLPAARAALAFHQQAIASSRGSAAGGYAVWLLFNSIHFATFLGPPVVAVAAMRLVRSRDERFRRFLGRFVAGLMLLLLSGAVRGDFGLVCVPFMALALPAALGGRPIPARDAAWMCGLLGVLCLGLRAAGAVP